VRDCFSYPLKGQQKKRRTTVQGILHKPVVWIGVLAAIAVAVIVFVALYSGGGGSGAGY
jgi:hypothetical protein